VILTQIYHGSSELDAAQDPKWNTAPQWGNTRDNAVADSISVAGNLNIITAGDDDGNRQARMLGFIAIGG
jgi:hypothetical protein